MASVAVRTCAGRRPLTIRYPHLGSVCVTWVCLYCGVSDETTPDGQFLPGNGPDSVGQASTGSALEASPDTGTDADGDVYMPRWTCKRCHAPLNAHETSDGTTGNTVLQFFHGPGVGTDHAPEPVSHTEADVAQMVCDFCSAMEPMWVFPTRPARYTVTVKPGAEYTANDDDAWCACWACSNLIDGHDLAGLVRRALSKSPSLKAMIDEIPASERRNARDVFKEQLTTMYERFWQARTGEKVPMVQWRQRIQDAAPGT